MACTEKPMTRAVATTRPMASDNTGLRSRHRAALSACFASSYSSGAMNSTRNNSGSRVTRTSPPATMAMMRPRAI